MNIMIKATPRWLINGDVIDRNVEKIKRMGIDMKTYFQSSLALFEITDEPSFPNYHTVNDSKLINSSLNSVNELK